MNFAKLKKRISIPTFVGIIFSFSIPFLAFIYSYLFSQLFAFKSFNVYWVGHILLSLIIIVFYFFIVLKWEKKSLKSIGLKKPKKADFLWGAMGVFLYFALIIISVPFIMLFKLDVQPNFVLQGLSQAPPFFAITGLFVSVVNEEIIFRGYLLERFNSLLGNFFASALISWFFFSLIHGTYGFDYILRMAIPSIAFYFIYLRRRSLIANIIMHFLANSLVLLFFQLYLKIKEISF